VVSISLLMSSCAGDASFRFFSTSQPKTLVNLTIEDPSTSSVEVTCENLSQLRLRGTCSHSGQPVTASTTTDESESSPRVTVCSPEGRWQLDHLFAEVPEGSGEIFITHADSDGNTITRSRAYSKDPSARGLLIATAADLIEVRNNKSGCHHLISDVDLTNAPWIYALQLGNESAPFTGTINGNGFAVKNLRAPDAFIGVTRGATLKNLRFESPQFGQGAVEGGEGIVGLASQNTTNQPTRFVNVHLRNAEIQGVGANNRITLAGGLAAKASSIEIQDSSVEIVFQTIGFGSHLGGLIGGFYRDEANPSSQARLQIRNTRVGMELQWLPSSLNQAPNVQTGANWVGGLVGEVNVHLNVPLSFKISRSHVDLKAHADGQASQHGYFLGDSGGLLGALSAPCPLLEPWWIEETSVHLDVFIRSGSSGGLGNFGGIVGRRGLSQSCFSARDVSVTGGLAVSNGSFHYVAGALGGFGALIDTNLKNIFSGVRFDLTNTSFTQFSRGFFAETYPYFTGNQILASGLFFNQDVVPAIMGSEQLAAARTSAQMQTASTWIDAGYSTDIWNIQDGSLPTLKNISATVP